jgi:hypothetical protein
MRTRLSSYSKKGQTRVTLCLLTTLLFSTSKLPRNSNTQIKTHKLTSFLKKLQNYLDCVAWKQNLKNPNIQSLRLKERKYSKTLFSIWPRCINMGWEQIKMAKLLFICSESQLILVIHKLCQNALISTIQMETNNQLWFAIKKQRRWEMQAH